MKRLFHEEVVCSPGAALFYTKCASSCFACVLLPIDVSISEHGLLTIQLVLQSSGCGALTLLVSHSLCSLLCLFSSVPPCVSSPIQVVRGVVMSLMCGQTGSPSVADGTGGSCALCQLPCAVQVVSRGVLCAGVVVGGPGVVPLV